MESGIGSSGARVVSLLAAAGRVLAAAAAASLVACGGGGGGGYWPATAAGTTTESPASPPKSYAVKGSVTGLPGDGLVLQNNLGDDLAVAADGSFSFEGRLPAGASYSVTIRDQPTLKANVCVVANASGTMPSADVENVAVTCGIRASRFAYVVNTATFDIAGYSVNSRTGEMSPLAGPTTVFAPGGLGQPAADPAGRFLFVTDANAGEISTYAIDAATGALAFVPGSSRSTATYADKAVVDPTGRSVYVSGDAGQPLYSYTVDQATGVLTPAATAPLSLPNSPAALRIHPSGRFLYAIDPVGGIQPIRIEAATGAMTPGAAVPLVGQGSKLTFDREGRRIYALTTSGAIEVFGVDLATGALSAEPSLGLASLGALYDLAMNPGGTMLYACDFSAGTILSFAVMADGSLVRGPDVSIARPWMIAMDPRGHFLLTPDQINNKVTSFEIDGSDGTLGVPVSYFPTTSFAPTFVVLSP